VKWTATKLATVNLGSFGKFRNKLSACNSPFCTRSVLCPDGSSPSRLVRDGSTTTTTPPAATG
jgi:hypothetical protein